MKASQIQLLFALQNDLPSMRLKLEMSRLIGTYPDKASCRNRILNFVFTQIPGAVAERLLLRAAEALQALLNPAFKEFLSLDLLSKKGRIFTSAVPEYQMALHLRDAYVGHFIMNLEQTEGRVPSELAAYGGIYGYLDRLITKLEESLRELEYEGHDDLQASAPAIDPFTSEQLRLLIEAANAVEEKSGWSRWPI